MSQQFPSSVSLSCQLSTKANSTHYCWTLLISWDIFLNNQIRLGYNYALISKLSAASVLLFQTLWLIWTIRGKIEIWPSSSLEVFCVWPEKSRLFSAGNICWPAELLGNLGVHCLSLLPTSSSCIWIKPIMHEREQHNHCSKLFTLLVWCHAMAEFWLGVRIGQWDSSWWVALFSSASHTCAYGRF
jgi:hypothetical protein